MNIHDDDEATLEQRLRAHYAAEYVDTPDGAELWHALAGLLGMADTTTTEPMMELAAEQRVNGRVADATVPAAPEQPMRPLPRRRGGRQTGRLGAAMAVAAAALIVGMSFAIFHFANPRQGPDNGTIPHGALIADVQMLLPADGWAVGNADHQQTALVLHYTGGQWRLVASFANARLEHLSMVSATEGWAVGLDATVTSDQHGHRSFLVHYTGGKWVQVTAPIDNAAAIHMFSAESGYMVGLGSATDPSGMTGPPDVLAIYDHGHWRTSTLPSYLFPIALTSPTEGWASSQSLLWRLHDGQWAPFLDGHLPGLDLSCGCLGPWIDMVNANDGWAAGFSQTGTAVTKGGTIQGQAFLLHYGDERPNLWRPVSLPDGIPQNSELRFVRMQSADSGWAWGFTNNDVPPLLLRYDGHAWSSVPLPGNVDLSTISSVSPTEAWAAGQIGSNDSVLLHYLDGKWTVYHL